MVANGAAGVPWALQGGMDNPARAAREAHYATLSGQEGIASGAHCKVTNSGTADGKIKVGTGVLSILNRSPGAGHEMYAEALRSVTDIQLAATGGSARSDLVVVRIKDPNYAPWTPYTDPTLILNGPYAFPEIISGVANTVDDASQLGLTQSMFAVARVDLPSGFTTGTLVNPAWIVDLRKFARQKIYTEMQTFSDPITNLTDADTAFTSFANARPTFDIPQWASSIFCAVELRSALILPGFTDGQLRVLLRDITSGVVYATSDPTNIDKNVVTNGERFDFKNGMKVTVDSTMRGKRVQMTLQGLLTGGGVNGDARTQLAGDVRILEGLQ